MILREFLKYCGINYTVYKYIDDSLVRATQVNVYDVIDNKVIEVTTDDEIPNFLRIYIV